MCCRLTSGCWRRRDRARTPLNSAVIGGTGGWQWRLSSRTRRSMRLLASWLKGAARRWKPGKSASSTEILPQHLTTVAFPRPDARVNEEVHYRTAERVRSASSSYDSSHSSWLNRVTRFSCSRWAINSWSARVTAAFLLPLRLPSARVRSAQGRGLGSWLCAAPYTQVKGEGSECRSLRRWPFMMLGPLPISRRCLPSSRAWPHCAQPLRPVLFVLGHVDGARTVGVDP